MTRVLMSRVERLERTYPVSDSGAGLTSIDVALLAPRTSPTASTAWTTKTVAAGETTVLLAGPDADPTSAIVVPLGGGTLWFREVDNPEVVVTSGDDFAIY